MFDLFSQCFKLTDKYDKKEKAIEKHGQDFEISNNKTTFVKNKDIVAFHRCVQPRKTRMIHLAFDTKIEIYTNGHLSFWRVGPP